MFWLTFLHQIFSYPCSCLQDLINIVRLLLAAVSIKGLIRCSLLKLYSSLGGILLWPTLTHYKLPSCSRGTIFSWTISKIILTFVNVWRKVVTAGGQYTNDAKNLEMTETLAHGYSPEIAQWELSNEYQHDQFRWFAEIFVSLCFWRK